MKATFRARQTAGATLTTGAQGINVGYGNIYFVEVTDDAGAILFTRQEPDVIVVPPVDVPPTALVVSYWDSDKLKAAVLAVKPRWQVWCDSDTGPALDGSGPDLPAIRYGTAEDGSIVNLMDASHPYFAGTPVASLKAANLDALAQDAIAHKAALDAGEDPTKRWDTAWSTTDPRTMQLLILSFGYTIDGQTPVQQSAKYRSIFYLRYPTGRTPGINNPETDAGGIADTEAKRQAFANMLSDAEKALYLTPGK